MSAREWLEEVANGCLVETPRQSVSEWAAENVWLAPPMCPPALAGPYDLGKTPYVRRFMDLARDPAVRKVVVMKSSRTGFTEGFLNVVRWMPGNAPGPVLYAINSRDKARDVAKKRVIPSLREVAREFLTGKDDDVTAHRIQLANMDITITGSGSAGPFMEAWYQVVGLDEVEEHDDAHEETTIDRSEGRLVGVENGKLYVWSKPQLAGGPIHREYMRGTQERWWLPCPLCEAMQELVWEFVRFDHCRDLIGGWDLERVREETWYQCRHCGGKIEEEEKRGIVAAGEWRAESEEKRGGVRLEPGVVSMQVSDLISFHPEVRWGELAAKFLGAFKVNPDHQKQKFWWTNHLGLPWEERSATMHASDLERLKGGAVDVGADGTRVQVGEAYRWSYREGERVAPLPLAPKVLTLCADKQAERLKWVVIAWGDDWQGWVVDYGSSAGEWELLGLLGREYRDPKGEVHVPYGGLIDARFKPQEVFRACVASGGRLYPAMGLAESAELRGRSLKTRSDLCDGNAVLIYDFHNHTFESELYLNKIKRRTDPRLWLPQDMGDEFGRELCSARLVVKRGVGGRMIQKWDRDPEVPNDWGDAVKLAYVCREVLLANGW